MAKLSKNAEKLLSEILAHRDCQGKCDLQYWKDRFKSLPTQDEVVLRSAFGELKDSGMVSLDWGDEVPDILFVLAKGLSYFDEELAESSYTNIFYGAVKGIQIQQGTVNSTQNQENDTSFDEVQIMELINAIRKYDAALDEEYGEKANEIRIASEKLAAEVKKRETGERIKGLLLYIRDLAANAVGGIISSGIVQMISTIMR